MPEFSIIIPTINRRDDLHAMLQSLCEQTFKDFETIVVDQNKGQIIEDIIREFQETLDLDHIKIPAKGASDARNHGLEVASGAIVTFPDDDCAYPPDFLEQVKNYFDQHTELDGIVVSTMDRNDDKPIANLASKRRDIHRKNILSTVIEAGIFVKSAIIGNARFDIGLGVGSLQPYWSDEGPDFLLKLLAKGGKFRFLPDFKMYHPNPVRIYNEKTALRAYQYGMGRGYFLKKHRYPLRHIAYFLGTYIIGMGLGAIKLNKFMILYFYKGFIGRFKGYFMSEKAPK